MRMGTRRPQGRVCVPSRVQAVKNRPRQRLCDYSGGTENNQTGEK